MSDQQQPPYPPQQPYPYAPPPPAKKKHTVRNVLLILIALFILFVGGCMALIGTAANEAGKSIDKSLKKEAENDKPHVVKEGAAFEHDGYSAAKGWKVTREEFGEGYTIKGLNLTLTDDQNASGGGRSALLTFRLYNGKTVVTEITCSSNEMQEGETSRADCSSLESEKVGKWDTIKVADLF